LIALESLSGWYTARSEHNSSVDIHTPRCTLHSVFAFFAGEEGIFESIQYLEQLTERLINKDAEAVALLADRLLPEYVQAVAREAAAAVPEVVPVTVSHH
jgi:hypothetical protein